MNDLTLDEFIIGTLLEDGCIAKLGKGSKHHRWSCGHSAAQLDYLLWKVDFLKKHELHSGAITKCVSKSLRYKDGCTSYHSKSTTSPIFDNYRNMFYPEGVKRVLNV